MLKEVEFRKIRTIQIVQKKHSHGSGSCLAQARAESDGWETHPPVSSTDGIFSLKLIFRQAELPVPPANVLPEHIQPAQNTSCRSDGGLPSTYLAVLG